MTEHSHGLTGRAESGAAVVRITDIPYRSEITLPEGHSLIADEPEFAGGGNAGAAPIDLLVASLAAGKAVTLRMQADRHGWPMTGATVTARHRRVTARSLGEGARGMVDLFDCDIEIHGDDLTDQQRRRLCALTDTCWVQHALTHQSRVQTTLREFD